MSRASWDREGQTLSDSYPAVPESIPSARRAIVEFAEAVGAEDEQIDALRLAASEAISNVVRHAYPREHGLVHVTAALAGDELWLLVSDDGHGLSAATHSPGLGVGMALIAWLSDYFAVVSRGGGGTEVRMRFALQAGLRPAADREREELDRRLDLSARLALPDENLGSDERKRPKRFGAQPRGSVRSASSPASSSFSTTR